MWSLLISQIYFAFVSRAQTRIHLTLTSLERATRHSERERGQHLALYLKSGSLSLFLSDNPSAQCTGQFGYFPGFAFYSVCII